MMSPEEKIEIFKTALLEKAICLLNLIIAIFGVLIIDHRIIDLILIFNIVAFGFIFWVSSKIIRLNKKMDYDFFRAIEKSYFRSATFFRDLFSMKTMLIPMSIVFHSVIFAYNSFLSNQN